MSVPMEGKGEKSKGKRSTKNSKELRTEESDMEKALRKSQKEERKAAKRKAKEEKELEDVLVSRIETDRAKCASMMLGLRSSSVSIPPKLDVLGFTEGLLVAKGTTSPRICPFTGAKESDPNVEEKDPDVDPSLCFPSDPHSPDAPPESKDSGNDKALETNNDSDESLDSSLTKLLESHEVPNSISNISASSLLNLDGTLSNFVKMSGLAPSSHEKKVRDVARENLQGAFSSKRGCTIKRERVNSNDSGRIDIFAGLSESSSDRESIARSGSTSNQTGDSNGQSSSDATSVGSLTINQQMCDSISSTSDSWVDESDVLAAMQNLSLSSSRVVVSAKVFAGVMLKARPPSYDVSKLIAAQEKSFKAAQQDLDKRMTSLRASEFKKIQEPRKKMQQLVAD